MGVKPLLKSESLFELSKEEPGVSTAIAENPTTIHETNPLAIIQSAVDRGMEPAHLTQLFDLQERWEKNRAAERFGEAMARFQSNCPVVHKAKQAKSSGNFQGYTYASYDDVMRAAGPILKECGLAISFSTEQVEKQLKVTCRIRHGIHYEDHSLTVPVPDMRVSDTQKYGGAKSYAKRYALCAALNIVTSDEDNDAEGLHESINGNQLADLNDMLMSRIADPKRFNEYFGISRLDDLPVSRFQEAMTMLEKKPRRENH